MVSVTKTLFNAQVAYVKNEIRKYRQSEWDLFTSKLKFENKSIYKLNRSLLNKPQQNQPLNTPTGTKIYDTKPKAEIANSMLVQF